MDLSFFHDGGAYERFVGRWSRAVAAPFIEWLEPAPARTWLDAGCGTGALTQEILRSADPSRVDGIDPSAAQIESARRLLGDPKARFEVGDAAAIEAADATFDYVVSGLVLNFIPDPQAGVTEMARVTRVGGKVAAYVWDYADGMEMLRRYWDAAREVEPRAAERDAAAIFPICSPEGLREAWERAGLIEVKTRSIEVPTRFESFDDFWDPFLAGVGTAPAFNMELDEDKRERIRALLLETLPVAADGTISLTARVWAVTGRRNGG